LPILSQDVFESIEIDEAVSYNGGTGKVTNKVGESINPGEAVVTATEEPAPE